MYTTVRRLTQVVCLLVALSGLAVAQQQPATYIYFTSEALSAAASWFGYGMTPQPYIQVVVPHSYAWNYVEVTVDLESADGKRYSETCITRRAVNLPSTVLVHPVPVGTKLLGKPRVTPQLAGDEIPVAAPGEPR